MLIDAKDWELLMEQSELLMKKRSQMKQVQSVIVQEAVRSVELAPTKEVKIQLIEKLRSICEGKIHVELEYARLTVQLADIWDKDGKLKEATSLMQGLQVLCSHPLLRTILMCTVALSNCLWAVPSKLHIPEVGSLNWSPLK